MKKSMYNFHVVDSKSGDAILFNTKTGALVAFDREEGSRLQEVLEKPDSFAGQEVYNELVSNGFIVEEAVDEFGQVLERNRLASADQNRLDLFIMPNMNCNFSCTYCYEDHTKSEMTDVTSKAIMSWIDKELPKTKVLLVSWFGGEPLLSTDRVVALHSSIKKACNLHGVELVSHITTNGYLLSKPVARSLVELGILSFQITIDGKREDHDKLRPLRGGQGTYDRIRQNIIDLVECHCEVNLKLRINYHSGNLGSVLEMLDDFPSSVRSHIDIVFEQIFGQTYGKYDDLDGAQQAKTKVEDLYLKARSMGYLTTKDTPSMQKGTYCYADRARQYTVNFNGDVFKCTVSKFDSKYRFGYLTDDGTLALEGRRWDDWMNVDGFEDKCVTCLYMPMCMGGCRKVRGMWGTVGADCTLPFLGLSERVIKAYRGHEHEEDYCADK